MKNSKFEQAETERFNAFFIRAISFALFFLCLILIQFSHYYSNTTAIILAALTGLMTLLFIYASSQVYKIHQKIKKDPELKQALLNEMYINFDYRAIAIGFYSTLVLAVLLFLANYFIELSPKVISMVIIYVAVLTTETRRLFLYKQ